jgi:hypothetical protein
MENVTVPYVTQYNFIFEDRRSEFIQTGCHQSRSFSALLYRDLIEIFVNWFTVPRHRAELMAASRQFPTISQKIIR